MEHTKIAKLLCTENDNSSNMAGVFPGENGTVRAQYDMRDVRHQFAV